MFAGGLGGKSTEGREDGESGKAGNRSAHALILPCVQLKDAFYLLL